MNTKVTCSEFNMNKGLFIKVNAKDIRGDKALSFDLAKLFGLNTQIKGSVEAEKVKLLSLSDIIAFSNEQLKKFVFINCPNLDLKKEQAKDHSKKVDYRKTFSSFSYLHQVVKVFRIKKLVLNNDGIRGHSLAFIDQTQQYRVDYAIAESQGTRRMCTIFASKQQNSLQLI